MCPASFMIGGPVGSDTKLCQPCSSQSNTTQTRSVSEGSRKMIAPLEPCSFRSRHPLSKTPPGTGRSPPPVSSRAACRSPFVGVCSCGRAPAQLSAGEDWCVDEALLRVDRPQVLGDLEAPVSRLSDVHAHAHVVLARHHRRRPAGTVGDLGMIQRSDHVRLREGTRFGDGGRPEPRSFAGSNQRACSSLARAARCSWPLGTASRAGHPRANGRAIRAVSPDARSTCCGSRPGAHDPRDRRSALHLWQDRRPPHPAHLPQDRRIDPSRGRPVGDAAHRRPVARA